VHDVRLKSVRKALERHISLKLAEDLQKALPSFCFAHSVSVAKECDLRSFLQIFGDSLPWLNKWTRKQ